MERKIGEIFEYEGELYQCVQQDDFDDCEGCAFYEEDCSRVGLCSGEYRKDGQPVIYRKVENETKDITKMMKDISITATGIDVQPCREDSRMLDVYLTVDSDCVLGNYTAKEIISHVGWKCLIEEMDTEAIMSYLNSIGVKTEWEE